MHSFILAGGFATRLWPLTEARAKPLLPLAGKPLLSYAVQSVPEQIPITVSTNAVFADDFKAWKKSIGRPIEVSIEDAGHEDQKLGALGAVAHWITEQSIDDDILLLAGDNYVGCSMERFLSLFQGNPLVAGHDISSLDTARAFGTIVLEHPPSPIGRGAGGEGTKRVSSFIEKPTHPTSTIVSTGWWILPKHTLPILTEYAQRKPDNVGGIFEEFLARKMPIDCFVFHETWKDIGSFESYLALHREIVGEKGIIHPSASIKKDVALTGSIDIGPNVHIEKSTLRDCIIFGNSRISDCVLERCIIDERCTLEGIDLTDKMLRMGTVLKRRG